MQENCPSLPCNEGKLMSAGTGCENRTEWSDGCSSTDDQITLHFPWGLLRSHSTFLVCYSIYLICFFPPLEKQLENEENSIWECFPDFFVKITGGLVDLSGDRRFWQFCFQVLLLVRQKELVFMMRHLCSLIMYILERLYSSCSSRNSLPCTYFLRLQKLILIILE